MNEPDELKHFSKATVGAWVVGTMMVLVLMMEGSKLPYVQTDLSRCARFYVLLPGFIGAFLYFGIFHKWRIRKTNFLKKYTDKEERFRMIFSFMIGVPLFSWFLASTSIGLPAWLADLTASDPFTDVYRVEAITERGGPGFTGWFELELRDPTSGRTVMLPLKRTDYAETMYSQPIWRVGETLCVRGRVSFFGKIIDKSASNADRC
jgi:hypothetical protein